MGDHERSAPSHDTDTSESTGESGSSERLPRRTSSGSPRASSPGSGTGGGGHAAFASAVNAGIVAVTHVTHRVEDFPLDQSLDEAGIGARAHNRFNWGLTQGRPAGRATTTIDAAPGGAGFGVSSLAIDLGYNERRKYITRNAPPGGRRFALIDRHEQRHVDDFQRRLAAEDTQLPQRVAQSSFPTVTSPIAAPDRATAESSINPLVQQAVRTAVSAFRTELEAAQDHIDSPDSDTARALLDLSHMDPEVMHGPFSDGDPSPSVSYAATPGELFVNGIRAQDVVQGQLADCYFAAALASVAGSQPEIIRAMIQPAGGHDYRVRFYQWEGDRRTERHVVVDDYLPHVASGGLGYMRSSEGTADHRGVELWPMIVEKAYAQLRGGYDDMGDGGHASHALSAITGYRPNEVPRTGSRDGNRFQLMAEALGAHQPVVMTTRRDLSHDDTIRLGLYSWHSYPVLSIDSPGRTVRLRNVWGTRFSAADALLASANGLTNDPEFTITFDVFDQVASDVAM